MLSPGRHDAVDNSDSDTSRQIPEAIDVTLESWRRVFENSRDENGRELLRYAAEDLWRAAETNKLVHPESVDAVFQEIAETLHYLAEVAHVDPDDAQLIFEQAKTESRASANEQPSPDDENRGGPQAGACEFCNIPLSIGEWLKRDLPVPDRLLGEWFTTTSRIALNAATGLGKTNFALALAAHMAAGREFLHWRAHRRARVLFVDGEMSRRLLKRRAVDVCRRCGGEPEGLFLLNREDIENFPPLNTPAGKGFIERVIDKIGDVDAVIFDNVMALIEGDMKDEEGWQKTLPLIDALTRRGIGQMWVHHTGHDASRGYGTKTREWRMDAVIHLSEEKRADTDVSFRLEFQKARERTPETRPDFENVTIALVNDEWVCNAASVKQGRPSPLGTKFLEALKDAMAGAETTMFQNWKAVNVDVWRAECVRRGLLDPKAKRDSARALFNKHRRELIGANLIACNGDLVWVLG